MKQKSNNYERKKYKKQLNIKLNAFVQMSTAFLIMCYVDYCCGVIENVSTIESVYDDGITKIDLLEYIIEESVKFYADNNNAEFLKSELPIDYHDLDIEKFVDFCKEYFNDSIKKVSVIQKESLPL